MGWVQGRLVTRGEGYNDTTGRTLASPGFNLGARTNCDPLAIPP